MGELGRDYQIIVVDDASTDSTPAVLSPYIRVLPLTVLRNAERRGYADSLELALREAVRRSPYPKRDAVIALQADFTEDPDVMPALIKRIEAGADVVGTDTQLEPTAPRSVRWGRRFLRWLLRRHEWAAVGDPLSGLRAYRIVVLKRALDARGTGRLLTWGGLGANAELLAQTAPVSRRSEMVDTTIKHHRLQRPSRFEFMTAWREVRGAGRGKPAAGTRPLPVDSVAAAPEPIAVEPATPPRPRGRDGQSHRRTAADRTQRPSRGPQREKQARAPKPVKPQVVAAPAAAPVDEQAAKPAKKRRRSRRKKKPTQPTPTLVVDGASPAEPAPAPAEPAPATGEPATATSPAEAGSPKKKSRRGRRGGRGRRKGPRPNEGTNNGPQSGNGAEAPPPLVAEGD
jgi:hypothetical protein